jgi:hypothetical protein
VGRKAVIILFFIGFVVFRGLAQETIIKGRITDATNGEGIPLAVVLFKGSKVATSTDFDGNYSLKFSGFPSDSLTANYFGYKTLTKPVRKEPIQTLNFSLVPESVEQMEVVITNKEDPAYAIIRKAVANKEANDSRKLEAYQYEMYRKIEIDLDNISDKMKNKWYMRKVAKVLDSVMRVEGEDGKMLIPMYISETIGDYYYRSNPKMTREVIRANKVTGIGISDNSILSQIINASFYDYNFYQNRIAILNRDFVSPLSDGAEIYYRYILEDSSYLGEHWCYKIDISPKRKEDLAFEGKIWITDSLWAIKQVNLSIGKEANLNFVDGMKIHQEMQPSKQGPWLPMKSRLLIDIGQIGDSAAGMLLKFYISNKDMVENNPRPLEFYREKMTVADTAQAHDAHFWAEHRHDSLTVAEKHVFQMIDSVKKVPIVRTYIEVIDLLVNGYYDIGKVDIGPLLYTYAYNNVEGNRFNIGLRSNNKLHKNWLLSARVAYGTLDNQWKYQGSVEHIFRRKSWSLIGFEYYHDIDQVALNGDNKFENNLFGAFVKFGKLYRRRPYFNTYSQLYVQSDLFRGFTQRISLKHSEFDPLYPFAYYSQQGDVNSEIYHSYQTTEIISESRYAKNATMIKNGNHRTTFGTSRLPVFTFRYTLGINKLWGSDFYYNKFYFNVTQLKNTGFFGRFKYSLNLGWTPNYVPYPLLENHLGNHTAILNYNSFNMMNFFEFTSDKYASLHVEQHFDGLFFNRVPFLKRLKWREVVCGQVLFGTVSNGNYSLIPTGYPSFTRLNLNQPYAEVSYGIENIFRLVRIDFLHRLTYLDNVDPVTGHLPRRFAVKIGLQFTL